MTGCFFFLFFSRVLQLALSNGANNCRMAVWTFATAVQYSIIRFALCTLLMT